MIDTVILTLTKEMFTVSKPEKFKPSAQWVLNPKDWFKGIYSKQNTLKRELQAGIYKPYLTLTSRIVLGKKIEPMLKIELSLPKFFFGNNFDELQYKDFPSLISKLQMTLENMGIVTTIEILSQAPISAIHYSKNIILTDGSTPYHYIQKIKETNSSIKLDINQTDYRNAGHCYKWHCNSYEVLFYDKIKDLEKAQYSSKRAIEKDNEPQLNIFNTMQKRKKFEVLRMEVRLNKRKKIKQLFNKLSINTDLTFKKLFKPAISKDILLHYLDEIEKNRPALLDVKKTCTKSFLGELIFNNPKLSTNEIFQVLGLKFALETITLRELRNLLFRNNERRWHVGRSHGEAWYRLIGKLKKINFPTQVSHFGIIRKQLNKFKACRLKNY